MKKLLLAFAFYFCSLTISAQIVINEVIFTPAPAIELKNLGTGMVDVSTLQLCSFPEYNALGDLTLVSGNLMLAPGEFLVVAGHTFSAADDEMGLYVSGPFGESDNILDYVEWGSTGHTRSSTAVAAGIWSTGFFVNVDGGGSSIEYDGDGDAPSDWLLNGTNSQGSENSNAGGGCEASAFVVGSQFVCEGEAATFQLILTGIGPWTFTYSLDGVLQDPVTTSLSPHPWMLTEEGTYDLMSVSDANCEGEAIGSVSVTNIAPPTAELSGPSEFCPTDANASLQIDFTGQGPWTFEYAVDGTGQGEMTVAENPITIPVTSEGLYTLSSISNNSCEGSASGSIEVSFAPLDGGELTSMGGVSAVTVCVDDDFPDPVTFDLANFAGENTGIVVTDSNNEVILLPESNVIDFDGSEAGIALVYNLSYLDGLTGLSIGATFSADLVGCFELSNSITVIRQTGTDCATSIEEFAGLQSFDLFPNPVTDVLNLRYSLEAEMELNFSIIDMTGKIIMQQSFNSYSGEDVLRIDLGDLTSGAYLFQLTSDTGGHAQRLFMK